MRKKAARPAPKAVRRGPGRPKKTAAPAKAAKRGRPPAKKATPAAGALTSHGLGKWKPAPGDTLITKSAGSFTLGRSSWRKSTPPMPDVVDLLPDDDGEVVD